MSPKVTRRKRRLFTPEFKAEAFFLDHLLQQRRESPYTVASYRDTFRLLLHFATRRLKKALSALSLADLDAPLVGAFLWLGHESVETSQMYLDADLALKERALARTAPRTAHAHRL